MKVQNTMKRWIYLRFSLFLLRNFVAIAIIVYLLLPTKITYSHSLEKYSGFNPTLSSTTFYAYHYFCSKPEGRAIKVKNESILAALNLPQGTKILNEKLLKYGKCMAKAIQVGQDRNLCNCSIYFSFLILMSISLLFAIIDICLTIRGSKARNIYCTIELLILSCLMIYQATSVSKNDIILPDRFGEPDGFFELTGKRFAILLLTFVYCVTCFGELISFVTSAKWPSWCDWINNKVPHWECVKDESLEIKKLMLARKLEIETYCVHTSLLISTTWP